MNKIDIPDEVIKEIEKLSKETGHSIEYIVSLIKWLWEQKLSFSDICFTLNPAMFFLNQFEKE